MIGKICRSDQGDFDQSRSRLRSFSFQRVEGYVGLFLGYSILMFLGICFQNLIAETLWTYLHTL